MRKCKTTKHKASALFENSSCTTVLRVPRTHLLYTHVCLPRNFHVGVSTTCTRELTESCIGMQRIEHKYICYGQKRMQKEIRDLELRVLISCFF